MNILAGFGLLALAHLVSQKVLSIRWCVVLLHAPGSARIASNRSREARGMPRTETNESLALRAMKISL